MFYLETDTVLHKLGHFHLCNCVLFVAISCLDHVLFCFVFEFIMLVLLVLEVEI